MEKIWTCKIGGDVAEWPHHGADAPMRHAIEAAYQQVTGRESEFKLTGWGGSLDLWERAAVTGVTPTEAEIEKYEDDQLIERGLCDPWLLQKRLMRISDQHMPSFPQLTSEGILYAALILEEVGEMCDALGKTIAAMGGIDSDPVFSAAAKSLGPASKAIRDAIAAADKRCGPLREGFKFEEAVEVADALTDIMVVTAGAALAMGLQGQNCYHEVQGSNLSKANPDTGVIDKDPSGKWIKGKEYYKPDLMAVLYGSRAPEAESEGGHVV